MTNEVLPGRCGLQYRRFLDALADAVVVCHMRGKAIFINDLFVTAIARERGRTR